MNRKTIEDRLFEVFEDIFNLNGISVREELIQTKIEGWDSIGHVRLIMAVEEEFDLEFPVDEAVEFKNFHSLADYLEIRLA